MKRDGSSEVSPNPLSDAVQKFVYDRLITKLWQRLPVNIQSNLETIFENFFEFFPYIFFGLVGLILIWIATEWFSTNIIFGWFKVTIGIGYKLLIFAVGALLEIIELMDFHQRKIISDELRASLDLEQKEYKDLKYKITQAVYNMTYIGNKNSVNLDDIAIRYEAGFDVDIKDDMKVFEYRFKWSGQEIRKPIVYLTDGDLTVKGKEHKYTPENADTVKIRSLPGSMGVAQVEVTFNDFKRKDEPNGQLHIVLVWLFKGQTKKVIPFVDVTSNKYLFDLKKAVITLQFQIPRQLIQKKIYSRYTKPQFIATTETSEFKLTDKDKDGENYKVIRELGIGKEEAFENRMVYGLAFNVKGIEEKIINKDQDY